MMYTCRVKWIQKGEGVQPLPKNGIDVAIILHLLLMLLELDIR